MDYNNGNPHYTSSCLVQSRWDWTDSAASNKWGAAFQAYRPSRYYFTSDEDGSDGGSNIITSKTKLRGRGRVLSLKMETEPGKDCQLLGWSTVMGVNGSV